MTLLRPFFLALSLLSRLPVPARVLAAAPSDRDKARSVLFYPVVGALIGFLCGGAAYLLMSDTLFGLRESALSPELVAAAVLVLSVLITGALHLDGLADAVDASFASHKHGVDLLKVFKDTHTGTMAVVAVVCVLLLKYVALLTLIREGHNLIATLAILFTATRVLAVLYMATTPYVSAQGLVSGVNLERYRTAIFMLGLTLIVCILMVLPALSATALILVFALWCYWWRKFWVARIGGYTGDCLGALIEVAETAGLLIVTVIQI